MLGDALGLDNGAHTVNAYWHSAKEAFGSKLPGPFGRCCRAPVLSSSGSLRPRGCDVLLPFIVSIATKDWFEATRRLERVSMNGYARSLGVPVDGPLVARGYWVTGWRMMVRSLAGSTLRGSDR